MKTCVICGEVAGLDRNTIANKDIVCRSCMNRASLSVKQMFKLKKITAEDIREAIRNNSSQGSELLDFKATSKFGNSVHFDDNQKKFLIPAPFLAGPEANILVNYDDIKTFEMIEDGETVTSGGLGRALAGGILFGQTGAVVGAVTGGKKSKGICTTMKMKLDLVNPEDKYNAKIRYITFIAKPTKKNSQEYLQAVEYAQQSISKLQLICDEHKQEEQSSVNETEKILEYKNLLDQGVITEEEFAIKKKELLGL